MKSNLQTVLLGLHGKSASEWLRQLPEFIKTLESRLNIQVMPPYAMLSYHYVAPVLGPNNEDWVLKCAPSLNKTELAALKHFNGSGCVRLIQDNETEGWMLIERCLPGTVLQDNLNEEETIAIALSLMKKLHQQPRPTQGVFPKIDDLVIRALQSEARGQLIELLPTECCDFVQEKAPALLSSQSQRILIHGDLHYQNIIQQVDQYLAIDPKGVLAESEAEIPSFLRNAIGMESESNQVLQTHRNLDQIIEITGFDKKRVLLWCIVQASMWSIWFIEDQLMEDAEHCAEYTALLFSLYKEIFLD